MSEFQNPHTPSDLLDHLVLDTCEFEGLAERLIQSLTSVDLETMPRGAVTVQLMDVLFRMKDASATLHRVSGDQIKKVADAPSSDLSGDQEPIRRNRNRILVNAVDG